MLPQRLHELAAALEIPEKEGRLLRLKALAAELGVMPAHASEHTEHHLSLVIYDGFLIQEACQQRRKRNVILIAGTAILVIIFFPVFKDIVLRHGERFVDKKELHKGYDDDGNLVTDKTGKAELFEDMQGYYDEFYEDGTHHFTYRYDKGTLVEQIEFDRQGEVIAHDVFDENGNPIPREEE